MNVDILNNTGSSNPATHESRLTKCTQWIKKGWCSCMPPWANKLLGVLMSLQTGYFLYSTYIGRTMMNQMNGDSEASTVFSIAPGMLDGSQMSTTTANPAEIVTRSRHSARQAEFGGGSDEDGETEDDDEKFKELDYTVAHLHKYGYLTNEKFKLGRALLDTPDLEAALREYQRFMNIRETGRMDDPTADHMAKPRCGNKDFEMRELWAGKRDLKAPSANSRQKRYAVLSGRKWSKRTISYRIVAYPTSKKITQQKVDLEIARAFNAWSKLVPLKFERISGDGSSSKRADIELKFVRDSHGDCKLGAYDKSDDSFAHAYGPAGGGSPSAEIHFNDHFRWAEDSSEGQTLYSAALHEIGHSLGLMHSDFGRAIMYPTEREEGWLHEDDVYGIQAIYGKRKQQGDEDKDLETTTTTSGRGDGRAEKKDADEQNAKKPTCGADGRWLFPGPDCKQFYDCRGGSPKLRSCAGNLVWNRSKNLCDFVRNVAECKNHSS